MFRDYQCVLLADCMGEPIGNELPRTNHEASLLVIQTLFGWVSDSAQFRRALEAEPIATSLRLTDPQRPELQQNDRTNAP